MTVVTKLYYPSISRLNVENIFTAIETKNSVMLNIAKDAFYLAKNSQSNTIDIIIDTPINKRKVTIRDELDVLLNVKTHLSINTNTDIENTDDFYVLSKGIRQHIEQSVKLIEEKQKEAKSIKQQLISCDSLSQDSTCSQLAIQIESKKQELQTDFKLANLCIFHVASDIKARNHHLQKMEEIYKQNINESYENSHEVFQAVYQLAEIQIQNELMQEIQEVSEKIVAAAQKNNAVPVFIGRSPIAFAAYIKKHYEDMQVITIPLSGLSTMNTETITETELDAISAHLDKYLLEITKSKNILIVDYIDSGDSFNKLKLIISMYPYQNKTFYCAIYSTYSSFLKDKRCNFNLQYDDTMLKISENKQSPLASAIDISSFDNLAPYNAYTLKQIINGEPEPMQSTDGFDLLTEML
jgi:hypothetical protein